MISYQSLTNALSKDWFYKPNTLEKVSGVVFPLFGNAKHAEGIILTQRAKHLKSHPGQISFPGGVLEPTDQSLLDCALREWEEEMGVSQSALEVLGRLTGLQTRTGFHITPFLANYKGDFQFPFNKDEVESVFVTNFSELWECPFYAIQIPNQKPGDFAYYFDLKGGLLWGATCEIILGFLKQFLSFDRIPKIVKPNLTFPPFLNPKIL
ncbi:CoA pyrophosphatase [Leptospira sp. 96542]|nr:CoA pyrophosphatase [Leptospira sp. 96542]